MKSVRILLGVLCFAAAFVWVLRDAAAPVRTGQRAGRGEGESRSEPAQPKENWLFVKRTYPRFELPDRAPDKLLSSARTFRKDRLRTALAVPAWTPVGPSNIGGRVTAAIIHPTNPDIFYIAAASGGVWKTTNFGGSWTNVFNESFSIGSLAFDPTNPSVIYVGTGEANPSSVDTYPGNGVWRSTDAGATWTNLGLAETGHISKIAVNPLNPNTILVAAFGLYRSKNTDKGIYRSTDAGATWTQVLQVDSLTGASDLQISPGDTTIVLAATHTYYRQLATVQRGGAGSGLYLSTDGGATWALQTLGIPFYDPDVGSISIDIAKNDPYLMFANVSASGGFSWGGLYKGYYIPEIGESVWYLVFDASSTSESQVWYNNILRVHPVDTTKIWAGMTSMYRTTNQGTTFPFASISGNYHVDHHVIEYAPSDTSRMVFGNDGGVFTSTNGGATWVHCGNLPITQFYAGSIDAQNTNHLIGGAQDNSTMLTHTGQESDWTVVYGGDGFNTAVDPTDSNRIYVESQYGGLSYSTNGGATWFNGTSGINPSEPKNWQMPFVLDPQHPQTLYAGTNYLYKSTDGAASWLKISPILTNGSGVFYNTLSTIDVAPTDANVVYVGTCDSHVWVTTNGGSTWYDVSAGLPVRWVSRVTADRDSANVAYVALSGFREYDDQGHLYRTNDYGATWTDIGTSLPDIPLNDVLVDPLYPHTLYVASDLNVMVTTDLGGSWNELGTGLPAVTVHDIDINTASRTMGAFTHGRSVFTVELPLAAPASVEVPVGAKWNLLSAPLEMEDYSVASNYPDAVSQAFAFTGGTYSPGDSILPGRGYWVKFPDSPVSPRTLGGVAVTLDSVDVEEGWNIVGSISDPVAVGSVTSDPPGLVTSQFFGYDGKYQSSETILPGAGYWVKVSGAGKLILSSGPPTAASAADRIVIRKITDVPPPPPEHLASGGSVPSGFALYQNYPNPFNPVTTIGYDLASKSDVLIRVFDPSGRLVRVLRQERQEPGRYTVGWDGRDDAGRILASGVYLYQARIGAFVESRKMVFLK